RVAISAPGKGEDITLVMGVNHERFDPRRHHVISNASCTTNCLGPVAKVLADAFGLRWGLMSTVHSYTNSQHIHDRAAADPRESRAGALNIIPTTSGAALALIKVLPELAGSFEGMAFRVPTPTVSVIDFVTELKSPATTADINASFERAATEEMRGILAVCRRPLVSMDFKGNPNSAIVDVPSTVVLDERIVKVVAWYDNEWGYSCRMADLAAYIAERERQLPEDRRIEQVVAAHPLSRGRQGAERLPAAIKSGASRRAAGLSPAVREASACA
ncbi:MAG: type I glyceraldehyde-3-phosphate dehydrogenase, partial [Chloroflexota bacterium]